jgi:hypothetical protein
MYVWMPNIYGALPRQDFHSRLFQRFIEPNEMYYWKFVYAELLYRTAELEEADCSCMTCQTELNNYRAYLDKLKNKTPVV